MKKAILIVIIVAAATVAIVCLSIALRWASFSAHEKQFIMGSIVSADIYGNDRDDVEKAVEEVMKDVSTLENQISKNKAGTPVYELNKNLTVKADAKLCSLFTACNNLSERTNGAFDVTIGSLSTLWDFDGGQKKIPTDDEINAVLPTVGYEKIKIDAASNTITIPKSTIVDFGAVGKGLACDKAMEVMKKNSHVTHGVVSVGGSVAVYGKSMDVGIRDPFGDVNTSFATLKFHDAVVSTSGVYEKYFEQDGKTYHHLLDTKTGKPIDSNLVSVTVVCQSGFMSDALSTACYAVGVEKSIDILTENDAMGIFVTKDKKVIVVNEKYDLTITDSSYEKV